MKEILVNIIGILAHLTLLAFDLLMIALPFLFIYAIYRVIKGLMTHNAELKAKERERNGHDL